MPDIDINRIITEEVDEIDDEARRDFIKEILAFERSKMDKRQPHFKNKFDHLIEKYGVNEDEIEEVVES